MGIYCEVSEGSRFASGEKQVHDQSLDSLVVVRLEVHLDGLESTSMPGYFLSCGGNVDSVPNRLGAQKGLAGGLPGALDGTELPVIVRDGGGEI